MPVGQSSSTTSCSAATRTSWSLHPVKSFAPDFSPDLAPAELLRLGVFGGRYMTDCGAEFPRDWFAKVVLSPERHDPKLNYFGVNASQPLAVWRAKGWIHPDDPRGWFQWYCRYFAVAVIRTTHARSNAGAPSDATSLSCAAIARRTRSIAGHASVRRCCTGPTTHERSEGFEMNPRNIGIASVLLTLVLIGCQASPAAGPTVAPTQSSDRRRPHRRRPTRRRRPDPPSRRRQPDRRADRQPSPVRSRIPAHRDR